MRRRADGGDDEAAGQPLTEAEYAAYAKRLDALGFVKRNAAI